MVRTSLGVLKDAAPVNYQRIGGERVPVESAAAGGDVPDLSEPSESREDGR